MNDYALDSPAVRMMDELLWKQTLRIYVLTEKNGRRKEKVLRKLGMNLN